MNNKKHFPWNIASSEPPPSRASASQGFLEYIKPASRIPGNRDPRDPRDYHGLLYIVQSCIKVGPAGLAGHGYPLLTVV